MTQAAYELPTANGAFRLARVAFVQAGWHADIVDNAYKGFIQEIAGLGFPESAIDRFPHPGRLRDPPARPDAGPHRTLRRYRRRRPGVDGGIYRHDFVANAVVQGLMQVQLSTEVPVFSVVLTPHHYHEHDIHHGFFKEHFLTKGAEAAKACAITLDSLAKLAAAA